MGAEQIISHLYAIVFLIGLAGYVPQIFALVKNDTDTKSISLLTWWVWLSSWIISLLYGVLCLSDIKFCIVASINIAGHITVMALIYYKRMQEKKLVLVHI